MVVAEASCVGPAIAVGEGADPGRPAGAVADLTRGQSLEQGGRTWDLGTADAADREDQYAISWTVTIPPGVALGAATLNARSASLPVQIR